MLEREDGVDIPDPLCICGKMIDSWFPMHIPSTPNYVFNLPITSDWDLPCAVYVFLWRHFSISVSPDNQHNRHSRQVCCTSSGDCFVEDSLCRRQRIIPVEYQILSTRGLVPEHRRFCWVQLVDWSRSCWITKRYRKMRWGWNVRQLRSNFTVAAYLCVSSFWSSCLER